ncbi:hypothetical protein OWR28_06850 [Chryseobacterium sp. 1B4]
MAEDVKSVRTEIVECFNHYWKNSIGTGFSPFNQKNKNPSALAQT